MNNYRVRVWNQNGQISQMVHFDADNPKAAINMACEWAKGAEWDTSLGTVLLRVYVCDDEGHEQGEWLVIHPDIPVCKDGKEHSWQHIIEGDDYADVCIQCNIRRFIDIQMLIRYAL